MSYNMQKRMNDFFQPNNNKLNHKSIALFDYLRSFSQTGLQTLDRIQYDFNQAVLIKKRINADYNVDGQIKTILQAYEIFVFEIYDSCVFVQIQQFGKVVLKIFGHLMIIIKSILKEQNPMIKNSQIQENSLGSIALQQNPLANNKQKQLKLLQQNNKKMVQVIGKRHYIGYKNSNFSNKQQVKTKQQDYWKDQVIIDNIRNNTNKQLKKIDTQLNLMSSQLRVGQQKLIQTRQDFDKLQNIVINRQGSILSSLLSDQNKSKSQQILSEIIYVMKRKGETIQRFAQMRKKSCNQNQITEASTQQNYNKFCNDLREQFLLKIQQVKTKIFGLFKQKFIKYQNDKKSRMPSFECQAIEEQVIAQTQYQQDAYKFNKYKHKLHAQKLKAQLNILKSKYDLQCQLKQNLKKLLQQKTATYQEQNLKLRNQIFSYQRNKKKNKRYRVNDNFQNQYGSYSIDGSHRNKITQQDFQDEREQFNADQYKISLKNVRKIKNSISSSVSFLKKKFIKFDQNGKKMKLTQKIQNNQNKELKIQSKLVNISVQQNNLYEQQQSCTTQYESLFNRRSSQLSQTLLKPKFILINQDQTQIDNKFNGSCKKKSINDVMRLCIDNFTQTQNKIIHLKSKSNNDLRLNISNDKVRDSSEKGSQNQKQNNKICKQIRNKSNGLCKTNHQNKYYKQKRKSHSVFTQSDQTLSENKLKNQSLCQRILRQVQQNDKSNPHHKLLRNKFLKKAAYKASLKIDNTQQQTTRQIYASRVKRHGSGEVKYIKNQFISLNFSKQN